MCIFDDQASCSYPVHLFSVFADNIHVDYIVENEADPRVASSHLATVNVHMGALQLDRQSKAASKDFDVILQCPGINEEAAAESAKVGTEDQTSISPENGVGVPKSSSMHDVSMLPQENSTRNGTSKPVNAQISPTVSSHAGSSFGNNVAPGASASIDKNGSKAV